MTGFGRLADGREVRRIEISAGALRVGLLDYGARLQEVRLDGLPWSLVLGSPVLAPYEGRMAYFGALVGPVANRIAGASAEIAGRRHALCANEDGVTTLHGGWLGTHARVWQVAEHGADHATLTLTLPDGEEGFPGRRRIAAAFRVTAPAALEMELTATTDAETHLNLANHAYWRLGPGPDLTGHRLTVAANRYLPVDARRLPTGEIRDVTGTPFDFRAGRAVGAEAPQRYDHNLCLADARRAPAFAARLVGPGGLRMDLATTEPGLQIYDAARLDTAPDEGLEGRPEGAFAGLALEPQGWPDALHRPAFPPTLLRPGETYRQLTRWSFDAG